MPYEFRVSGTTTIENAPALDEVIVVAVLAEVTSVGEKSTASKGHVQVVGVKLLEGMILSAKEAAPIERKLRGQVTARDQAAVVNGLGDADFD